MGAKIEAGKAKEGRGILLLARCHRLLKMASPRACLRASQTVPENGLKLFRQIAQEVFLTPDRARKKAVKTGLCLDKVIPSVLFLTGNLWAAEDSPLAPGVSPPDPIVMGRLSKKTNRGHSTLNPPFQTENQ
jgi:hypothetical protein